MHAASKPKPAAGQKISSQVARGKWQDTGKPSQQTTAANYAAREAARQKQVTNATAAAAQSEGTTITSSRGKSVYTKIKVGRAVPM